MRDRAAPAFFPEASGYRAADPQQAVVTGAQLEPVRMETVSYHQPKYVSRFHSMDRRGFNDPYDPRYIRSTFHPYY